METVRQLFFIEKGPGKLHPDSPQRIHVLFFFSSRVACWRQQYVLHSLCVPVNMEEGEETEGEDMAVVMGFIHSAN